MALGDEDSSAGHARRCLDVWWRTRCSFPPGAPRTGWCSGRIIRRLIRTAPVSRFCMWTGARLSVGLRGSPGAQRRDPTAYALMFTGKGDRVDRWITAVAIAWGDRPVEVWGMNYPGSGASDGPVKLKWVAPSALAVFDAVQKIAGHRPIFTEGASFGTTPALLLAARRPVAGIIIHNPPPLRQLILGRYGWWNLWLVAGPVAMHVPIDLDSVANAGKACAPCVFIVSEADEIIPPAYHQLVIDAYKGPQRVIRMPGASHDAPLSHEAAIELSHDRDWMWALAGL